MSRDAPLDAGSALKGVTVVELGHIVAGPTAGMVLRQMGATVIKVEDPHAGDPSRSSPVPGTFVYLNRGKTSVGIDLKAEGGYRRFQELIRTADVLITNLRLEVLERLRVTYDDLKAINEGLIYGRISGYPRGRRYRDPALDEVIQMECGLAMQTGPSGRPLRAGASIVDMTSALFVVLGVLSALAKREQSGAGMYVESSLWEAGVFFMGQAIAGYELSGIPPVSYAERDGGAARVHGWGVYDVFVTRDGVPVFVGVTSNSQWHAFCDALQLPELAANDQYKTNGGRLAGRDHLLPIIRDKVQSIEAEVLLTTLGDRGIPHARVRRPEEVLEVEEARSLFRSATFQGKALRLPSLPLRFADQTGGIADEGDHVVDLVPDLGVDAMEPVPRDRE